MAFRSSDVMDGGRSAALSTDFDARGRGAEESGRETGLVVSQPRGRRTSMKVGGHWTGQASLAVVRVDAASAHRAISPSLIPHPPRILHTLDQTADPDPVAIRLPSSYQATISPTR